METKIKVTGMTCQHCVKAVTEALRQVHGVDRVDVSLEKAQAIVEGTASRGALLSAVKEEGYDAE